MSRRAVFLDRDGVINENRADHVKSLDEFVLLPGAVAALVRLAPTSLALVVVSNQSVIGRGLASRETVDSINQALLTAVQSSGGRLDGIYYCPHGPDDGCDCRKPRPGLLRRAAAEHDLDLEHSYMIGDAVTDVALAEAVGCRPILVLTGRGRAQRERLSPEQRARTHIVQDVGEAVDWILEQEKRREGDLSRV